MKYLILILISASALAQAQIPKNHPCFKNNDSMACLNKIKSAIFFATSVDGTQRSEYSNLLNGYFEKYGIEGFYKPESQHRTGSMLAYAIRSSGIESLNKKLIHAVPKGHLVSGLNIYDIVINGSIPFTRNSELKAYVANLKLLFPENGNEDFKITREKFGLPWDDPHFMQDYLARMKAVLDKIDGHNTLFKKTDFLDYRKEIEKIVSRASVLDQLPRKMCEINSYDEFQKVAANYGDVIKSKNTDVIGCLIENKKFTLVEEIIEKHEYDTQKLPAYFDKVAAAPGDNESFKLGRSLFLKMAQNDQKMNSVKGEKGRAFLQKSSAYLNKYDLENIICEIQPSGGTTINDLGKDLEKMLYADAYALMEEILSEKVEVKKELLLDQFSQLTELGINLTRQHSSNGKTIMHLIAESGDVKVMNSLRSRKVSLMNIGSNSVDKNGDTPLESAVKMASKKSLIAAQDLFQSTHYSSYEDLKSLKKKVQKSKPADEESKNQRKIFLDIISVELSRTY